MKRLVDILFSVSGLILLLPILAAIAVIVLWQLGNPVLFRQQRPGLNGRPFCLVKFRTMRGGPDEGGEGCDDAVRLSALGKVLRSLSLDELPELWNVLRGDMSIVGPRPLLMDYLPLYNRQQMRRHEVKPGITGWAQVNGRNRLSWEDRFALDVWYVDNRSMWLDLKIMFLTIVQVFRRHGITAEGEATMSRFTGSKS